MRIHSDMLGLYPIVEAPVQDSLDDASNRNALQDFWWFDEFVAHSGLAFSMPAL